MAHRNDPWDNQRLDPEDAHLEQYRGKLGFSRMIEERKARRWLEVACPRLSEAALAQQVRFAIETLHKSDETYAETSARLSREWAAKAAQEFAEGKAERGVSLTKEELERLAEHFANANDPVAISIHSKAMLALAEGQ